MSIFYQLLTPHYQSFQAYEPSVLTPLRPIVKFDNFGPSRTHSSAEDHDRNLRTPSKSKQTKFLSYLGVFMLVTENPSIEITYNLSNDFVKFRFP